MILSVSRRTDIPAFYSNWFYNKLKEGFVQVRNPFNRHQIRKVPLNKEAIDGLVFWTKNPEPMLPRLPELKNYVYYFQFSLNPYSQQIEPYVPPKKIIIETFKRLSDLIGRERMIWRYDPILLTDDIHTDYHLKYFEVIASKLKTYASTCVISFVDSYKKTEKAMRKIKGRELVEDEITTLAKPLAEIARANDFTLQTCAEKYDLDPCGIQHGSCIDKKLIETLTGTKIQVSKDKNQRATCGCVQSVDIGEYNTCKHGCAYCYANRSPIV